MTWYCETAHPVAVDSPDHTHPLGTKRDNHRNLEFNRRLVALIGREPVSVLDIGCAGGGMVQSFVEQGHLAVGIEGSDYSKNIGRAAWGKIPGNLFTADATKPFIVHQGNGGPFKFDAVTAWEFFEHIRERDLPGVLENIRHHLKVNGWLIGSIATTCVKQSGIIYHQTAKPEAFWLDLFRRNGFDTSGLAEMRQRFDGAWVRTAGQVKIVLRYGGR